MLLKKSDIAVRDVVENFSLSFDTFISKIKIKSTIFVVIVLKLIKFSVHNLGAGWYRYSIVPIKKILILDGIHVNTNV
jgi:hypothetical protein